MGGAAATVEPVKQKAIRIDPTLPAATVSEGDGVRYLHLDSPWIQGAMRIRKPLKLELDYVQRMMAWLLLLPPQQWPQARTLHLGLGAAALTKFCHGVLKVPTTAVEINPMVIAVCRAFFRLPPDDALLSVVQSDALAFLTDAGNRSAFDALCVDLYDHEAASPVLDDEDFYRACWSVLDSGGVMSVNLFGRDASFERSAQRIERAFGAGRVVVFKPTREGNTVVLGWKGEDMPSLDVLIERGELIDTHYGLPARKWVKMLSPYRGALPQASELKDNEA